MKRLIKWIKTPIGLAVTPVILSFILSIAYDLLKDKPIFSTIWLILRTVASWIYTFLNFELRVWWILTGIALIILVLYIIFKIQNSKPAYNTSIPFLSYTSDEIKGWLWNWRWEKNWEGMYDVEYLHPIRPNCKTPLVREDYRYGIICPRCGFKSHNNLPNIDTVKLLIRDNVKKDQFPRE
jgi:hypothetical protein